MANDLPVELYQSEQIRALEKIAIETYEMSEEFLMLQAGHAAFVILQQKCPDVEHVSVFCGPGKNGGDGYVVAYLAHENHIFVEIYNIEDSKSLPSVAQTFREKCLDAGIPMHSFEKLCNDFDINELILETDVIVDAIFGIGLKREVTGMYKAAIEFINQQNAFIMAIDVPSGLNADTGKIMGGAVFADVTSTFIGVKQGLLTADAPDHMGEILLDDLDLPAEVYRNVEPSAYRIDETFIEDNIPLRPITAHKGDFGHVLIVGGNYGMSGSVRMTAEAALRCGAGLVTIATRPEHSVAFNHKPEAMCYGIENEADLESLLTKATVVVLGPGLGQDDWANHCFQWVIKNKTLPMVIDADALNLLARTDARYYNWVLTPHPGEAARLLGSSVAEIQKDRFLAVSQLQQQYEGTVLLKGHGSLTIGSTETLFVIDTGNPGMASGGMGDVLSGIIGGLIAQKLPLEMAAPMAAWIHGKAGDLAALGGERGLLATDLMPFIRQLVNP